MSSSSYSDTIIPKGSDNNKLYNKNLFLKNRTTRSKSKIEGMSSLSDKSFRTNRDSMIKSIEGEIINEKKINKQKKDVVIININNKSNKEYEIKVIQDIKNNSIIYKECLIYFLKLKHDYDPISWEENKFYIKKFFFIIPIKKKKVALEKKQLTELYSTLSLSNVRFVNFLKKKFRLN